METKFTKLQKKQMVDQLIREISENHDELKQSLEDRDILLFRSFRLAHPELFHNGNSDEPVCVESLKQAFKDYLLSLSRMGFLTYYLEE